MSYGAAKSFYNSQAWRDTRRAYLESVNCICERCGKPAVIVHHKRYLTPDTLTDPSMTLDWRNLEALCMDCHNAEHMGGVACAPGLAFDENGDLIARETCHFIVVTGAPCSGKSTYIKAHASPGEPIFSAGGLNPGRRSVAVRRRSFIRCNRNNAGRAWIEACAITPALARDLQSVEYEVKPMQTSYEQCLEHLAHSDRDDKEQWERVIASYY